MTKKPKKKLRYYQREAGKAFKIMMEHAVQVPEYYDKHVNWSHVQKYMYWLKRVSLAHRELNKIREQNIGGVPRKQLKLMRDGEAMSAEINVLREEIKCLHEAIRYMANESSNILIKKYGPEVIKRSEFLVSKKRKFK